MFAFHNENIRYITAPMLDRAGVRHFFSTRIGGVSTGCFASLNFAEGSGEITDNKSAVRQNYELAANVFGLHASDVARAYQSHSATILTVGEKERGAGIDGPHEDFAADGLVTNVQGLLLSVRTADCVPILLADPFAKVVAAVHSGWRGTASAISANAIKAMEVLGADRERIIAAIGPCASVECYQVGDELKEFFDSSCFAEYADGTHLDLVAANRLVLLNAGINSENITDSGCCTVCDSENFFSHRRQGKLRGVNAAFICI